jgi:hypothetical protein
VNDQGVRLLLSETITRQVKQRFFEVVCDLAAELDTVRQLEKIFAICPQLSLSCPLAEMAILFQMILKCEIPARLGADKLISFLGTDALTRFQSLREAVLCIYWNDSSLAVIVLLLVDHSPFYYPFMSLTPMVLRSAAKFVIH